jgi:hypothetical protein
VRNAQTAAPELVARIRLETGLTAPKLNGLPGTPRRKDREASWPASLFGENTKFFCARLARARAVRAGGGEGRLGQSERWRRGPRRQCHLIAATSPVRKRSRALADIERENEQRAPWQRPDIKSRFAT